MKKQRIGYSSLIAVLVILSFVTSCFDRTTEEHPAKPSTDVKIEVDTVRRNAIRLLASRLQWYHEFDSIAVAKPGSTDGDILSIGKKRFVFKTRKALRADLNRVLDSLRRTGPLVMGNLSEETDTMPYKGPAVHGKMIRQYQTTE